MHGHSVGGSCRFNSIYPRVLQLGCRFFFCIPSFFKNGTESVDLPLTFSWSLKSSLSVLLLSPATANPKITTILPEIKKVTALRATTMEEPRVVGCVQTASLLVSACDSQTAQPTVLPLQSVAPLLSSISLSSVSGDATSALAALTVLTRSNAFVFLDPLFFELFFYRLSNLTPVQIQSLSQNMLLLTTNFSLSRPLVSSALEVCNLIFLQRKCIPRNYFATLPSKHSFVVNLYFSIIFAPNLSFFDFPGSHKSDPSFVERFLPCFVKIITCYDGGCCECRWSHRQKITFSPRVRI